MRDEAVVNSEFVEDTRKANKLLVSLFESRAPVQPALKCRDLPCGGLARRRLTNVGFLDKFVPCQKKNTIFKLVTCISRKTVIELAWLYDADKLTL